jgi:flagellar basal body-associated protein FliL
MKRKRTLIIVIVVVIAIMSFAATYAYANYFGPKTVLQANPDKDNCIQENRRRNLLPRNCFIGV